tara:strand:+ start:518 stop:763 length:246 start_codon:yes stop_codon:yes gene_type:complete
LVFPETLNIILPFRLDLNIGFMGVIEVNMKKENHNDKLKKTFDQTYVSIASNILFHIAGALLIISTLTISVLQFFGIPIIL